MIPGRWESSLQTMTLFQIKLIPYGLYGLFLVSCKAPGCLQQHDIALVQWFVVSRVGQHYGHCACRAWREYNRILFTKRDSLCLFSHKGKCLRLQGVRNPAELEVLRASTYGELFHRVCADAIFIHACLPTCSICPSRWHVSMARKLWIFTLGQIKSKNNVLRLNLKKDIHQKPHTWIQYKQDKRRAVLKDDNAVSLFNYMKQIGVAAYELLKADYKVVAPNWTVDPCVVSRLSVAKPYWLLRPLTANLTIHSGIYVDDYSTKLNTIIWDRSGLQRTLCSDPAQ